MTDHDNSGNGPIAGKSASPAEDMARYQYDLAWRSGNQVERVMWLLTLIAGLISLTVVLSVVLIAVVSMLEGRPSDPPEVLTNWGGIILGFYFGQFATMLRDFLGLAKGKFPVSGDLSAI